FLGESAHALGRGHLVDGLKNGMVDGLPKHDRGVFVEVRSRAENEAIDEAGDGHREDGRFKAAVPVADEEAQGEKEGEEEDGLEEQLGAARACFDSLTTSRREAVEEEEPHEEAEEDEEEIEEHLRDLCEPPGEEKSGAEGRGADVEVQTLAAYPKIHSLPRTEPALLPLDLGDLEVGDLPPGDAGLDQLVEVQG